jgi:threonine dehydrogenase-like Zn-dependent dehydrogenase
MMTRELDDYRSADTPLPTPNLGWNTYGVGVESMGTPDGPEPIDVPPVGPDQLLVRVDAVGLCYSDVKLIRQGGAHPKLYGRDLATEPTRLGHEATVTVVEVGENLREVYHHGQRLAVQPDIYVDGRSTAYGYTIPGGLVQYHLMGPEVLDADDGAYVIPVDDSIGYAAAALSEPWACVEAAYTQRRRLEPLAGGTMWIIGHPDDPTEYEFSAGLEAPRRIVLTDVSSQVAALVKAGKNPEAAVVIRDGVENLDAIDEEIAGGEGFDDIVVLDIVSSDLVSRIAPHIAFRGTMNLVGTRPLDGKPPIDVGRLHYHYTAYVGNSGRDIAGSYGEARNRAELKEGGVALYVGGGGPMGQMHMQRALEQPDGPATLIASDLDDARLQVVRDRLVPMAERLGRKLVVANTADDPDSLERALQEYTGGRGADDVIVSVPVPAVMEDAATHMAPDGMLNLFAGVPNGSMAPLDLTQVYLGNAQFTGTSGSRIADQDRVLDKALAGQLSPQRSLAAVGGIEAAREGVQAMLDGTFAGKIMIFPQLTGLPLMGLRELGEEYPEIGQHLEGGEIWTLEAEKAMIERFWS